MKPPTKTQRLYLAAVANWKDGATVPQISSIVDRGHSRARGMLATLLEKGWVMSWQMPGRSAGETTPRLWRLTDQGKEALELALRPKPTASPRVPRPSPWEREALEQIISWGKVLKWTHGPRQLSRILGAMQRRGWIEAHPDHLIWYVTEKGEEVVRRFVE